MAASGKGSGKRDFSERRAKLEKHIERLPDYAQRAQERLQKYLPPNEAGRSGTAPGGSGTADSASRSDEGGAERQRPRLSMPPVPVNVPVVEEARSKWAEWNAPQAKLERRKRRAARAISFWIVVCLILATVAGLSFAGFMSAAADASTITAGAIGASVLSVIAAYFGINSALRLRTLKRTELPVAAAPQRLPASGSAARAPMERLRESEATLAELLRQLSTSTTGAPGAVPEMSVEDARRTADEAAKALHGIADRIEAIERARRAAPDHERSALDSAVATLQEQLDDGLDGYGSLVAAAGRAVAASSGAVQPAKDALTDATDHLAGLAIALRELS
ncbi:hypothetical protein CFN78_04650 [Amycolatopsis antarctica]|uniref:Uncharacterized protein n=1 Tax=Amycolatopsis antarctica TaxID=1854586 RepID=A0A263DAA1_9PSEU|nr:hypothetical protein [Amycolatopsis antarctica]OZM74416.1 hypothetical protein CFN78_04650 [Amycolatopsis antarctica]